MFIATLVAVSPLLRAMLIYFIQNELDENQHKHLRPLPNTNQEQISVAPSQLCLSTHQGSILKLYNALYVFA